MSLNSERVNKEIQEDPGGNQDTLKHAKMRTMTPHLGDPGKRFPKREVKGLSQETRKISNKRSNFTRKGT